MSNKTLYVGNISYSATTDSLTSAFSAYGAANVRIIEGRGFAFIDVDADKLDQAITDMNGKSIDNRTLTVNEARPRGSAPQGSSQGGYRSNNRSGGASNDFNRRGSRW